MSQSPLAKSRVRKNTRRMRKLTAEFLQQGINTNAPCWICAQPIDYSVPPGTTEESHELDHYYPVSVRPDLQEDPANFRHAHRECNQKRSNRLSLNDLGQVMPRWW